MILVILTNIKARLIRHEKLIVRRRYIIEISVHEVSNSKEYPDRLKWGLVCIDRISGKKVLMDNHHPKGLHFHLDDEEFAYDFKGPDVRRIITEHMGVQI
jgi:hypothetical protein